MSDAIEPRKCGAIVLVSELLSTLPRQRKDLGGQIGPIFTHPDNRRGEDLAYVSVEEMGKGAGWSRTNNSASDCPVDALTLCI